MSTNNNNNNGGGQISEELRLMIEKKRQEAIEKRKRKLEEKQQQQLQQQQINNQNQKSLEKSNSSFVRSPQKIFKHTNPTNLLNVKNTNINNNGNDEIKSVPYKSKENPYTVIKAPTYSSPIKSSQSKLQNSLIKPPTTNSTTLLSPNKSQSTQISLPTIKISMSLLNNSRFEITCGYNTDIINIFKSISSKSWDPSTKKWSFAIDDFNEIKEKLKLNNGKKFKIEYENQLSDTLIKNLIDCKKLSQQKIDLSENLEKEFIDKLYPYQREGIIFGIQHNGKCLIADDMGLGKTVQAIGLAKWFRNDWPLLIVCPASLRYQWKESILKWIPDINDKNICVVLDAKELLPRVPVTIISYDLLTRMRNRFTIDSNNFYNMIILDESHSIKSDNSMRTVVTTKVAQSCRRIVLLSGTPALSRPIELFSQLNLLAPDIFPSKHGFGLRYCDAKQKTFFKKGIKTAIWDYKGFKNLDELNKILESTIMIRRLKKNVLQQLPAKKREMTLLSLDNLPEFMKEEMKNWEKIVKNSKSKSEKKILITQWFSKSAEVKVQAVNDYLVKMLDKKDGKKLICFCHHQSMMNGVEDMLRTKKIPFIRIDGSTSAKDRDEACQVFQNEKKFKIALLSLTACATGLNLTASSCVVFAETYWTPGVLFQAEDRVHRIGQSENVKINYLVAKGTIDELIWPLIKRKLDFLNKVGLSRDTFAHTHNPLEINDDQSLLTEFINSLEDKDLEPLNENENENEIVDDDNIDDLQPWIEIDDDCDLGDCD